MKALRVLTIVSVCAAFESAAAQVPQAPQPAQPALEQLEPQPSQVALAPQAPEVPQPPRVRPAAPQPPRAQRAAQTPRPVPAPAAPAAPAPPAPPAPALPDPAGQLLNIQVDVTIVAEAPGQAAVKKLVSLTVADRQNGMVRSNDTRNPGSGDTLNVDVQPTVQRNGQILTRVGVEYANAKEPPVVMLRAQPLLESGRPLLISRAASPNGDRTVTVEVVARILK
jgi:hypothetical protein